MDRQAVMVNIKYYKILVSVLIVITLCSCGKKKQEEAPNNNSERGTLTLKIDGQVALQEVKNFVSLGIRDSGTPGAKQAATYIASSLKELGIDPIIDEFTEKSGNGEITFRNITGIIPGKSKKTIIITSHYDTKSGISDNFIGANDGGSSTGLLLALAKRLKTEEPMPANIILAFLDGEECIKHYGITDGLHGSKYLAKTLVGNQLKKNIKAVIVLDMIGDSDLNISIPRNSTPQLISLAFNAAKTTGTRKYLSLSDSMILDDHVPFLKNGIPAIDLIDFEFGSTTGKNDYWHTTNDTMDKISANSLQIVGNIVLEMIRQLQE
jgi:hypothetical protein